MTQVGSSGIDQLGLSNAALFSPVSFILLTFKKAIHPHLYLDIAAYEIEIILNRLNARWRVVNDF
jgi:hypothetical protein